MLIREGVGERLREERERLGKNQTDFGELVSVSRGTQKAYELGSSSPDVRYLAALENSGVDVLYVLSGTRAQTAANALSEDESTLLANYCQLDEKGRTTVQDVTQALANAAQLMK